MNCLQAISVVTIAVNLPGPAAAARLAGMGAQVTKVEPPAGDPMESYSADWYAEMAAGQQVVRLDLTSPQDRSRFDDMLSAADVLITSNRRAFLQRLGLDWPTLNARFPRLCHVAIVGHPTPDDDIAGHDLTYQASLGLLAPPHLPRTLLADLVGVERAVSSALGLLLARAGSGLGGYAQVPLSEAAASLADPLRFGLTRPGALLGGGSPVYAVYQAKDGWVALAALEPRFHERIRSMLGNAPETPEQYAKLFRGKTADQWEQLGKQLDIPIARVNTIP